MALGALELAGLEQRVGQRVANVFIGQQADPGQVALHAGGLLETLQFEENRQPLLELLRLVDDPGVERKRLDQPPGAFVEFGRVRGQFRVIQRGGAHHVGRGQQVALIEVDMREHLAQHHVVRRAQAGLFENHGRLPVLAGLTQRIADGHGVFVGGKPAFEELQTLVGGFLVQALVDKQKHLAAGEVAGAVGKDPAALAQDLPGLPVILEFPVRLGTHHEHRGHARGLGPGTFERFQRLVVALLAEIRLRQVQPDDVLFLAGGNGILEMRRGQRQFVEIQRDQPGKGVVAGQVEIFIAGVDSGQHVARTLIVAVADQHGGQRKELDRRLEFIDFCRRRLLLGDTRKRRRQAKQHEHDEQCAHGSSRPADQLRSNRTRWRAQTLTLRPWYWAGWNCHLRTASWAASSNTPDGCASSTWTFSISPVALISSESTT